MAKPIVTQEAVAAAATDLVAAGNVPTIITVQAKIGGGSYTTVKRYLEAWQASQQQIAQDVALPETVAAAGERFVRSLWLQAAALAQADTKQARDDAAQQVAQVQRALTQAEATIAQLEAEAEAQAQEVISTLRDREQLRHDVQDAQAARQISETRAADLEQHILAVRAELAQARAAERGLAKLEGETAALRRQVVDQQTIIERLSTGRPAS